VLSGVSLEINTWSCVGQTFNNAFSYILVDLDDYELKLSNVNIKNTTFINTSLISSQFNLNLEMINSIISNNTMVTNNFDSTLLYFVSA